VFARDLPARQQRGKGGDEGQPLLKTALADVLLHNLRITAQGARENIQRLMSIAWDDLYRKVAVRAIAFSRGRCDSHKIYLCIAA
jgi:hypothetical protein